MAFPRCEGIQYSRGSRLNPDVRLEDRMKIQKKYPLLAFVLFLLGWLTPRPPIDQLLFLIRSPRDYFHHQLEPASYTSYHFSIRSRMSNEKGMLKAISRLPGTELQDFVARHKASLAQQEDLAKRSFDQLDVSMENGATFYRYTTRDEKEGGYLFLHNGKIIQKHTIYTGI
jgi:hypothetical protein